MNSTNSSRYQLIFDITISAIFISLAISLKIIFFFIPRFDLSIYILCISALFLKNKIALLVTIGVSLLSFFVEKSIIEWASYMLVSMLICTIFILIRKFIFKNKIILYALLPVLVLLYSTVSLFTWIGLYGKIEKYALYLSNLSSAYIICFLYTFATPLIFLPTLKLFENLFFKYSSCFNKIFINYFDSKDDNLISISNQKINYKVQLVIMIFSMMLLSAYFSYLPYKLAVWFNIYYVISILIVPILMLFVTPLWMKMAKRKGNKNVLQVNSIGILIAIIFTFSSFSTTNILFSNISIFVGIILFGSFIAGFLPINIEAIKSYEKRNNLKNKTSKYNALFEFWLIPLPFLLELFTKSTYVMSLFMFIQF
ncbi:hypothetical protein [Spiroplasma taiwanense]|uniref:hypothetical protein n=1 Tax=Spiroplasma taiwanense TaxID=2145 RepID=UPI00035A377A|nr:hypothetical protein [Spiroplasma taiwanense]